MRYGQTPGVTLSFGRPRDDVRIRPQNNARERRAFLAWRRVARARRWYSRGGRAGKPKTCWTKAPAGAVYGDCCGRQPIDERRCWAVRVVGAGGLSVVTWYAAAFAADRLVA